MCCRSLLERAVLPLAPAQLLACPAAHPLAAHLVDALLARGAGTTRADGETVGFETEGTAIYDTMCFVKNEAR